MHASYFDGEVLFPQLAGVLGPPAWHQHHPQHDRSARCGL
jgi:hypothetical protein